MDILRILEKGVKPWILAKITNFITAFIITGIVLGVAVANPLLGMAMFFTLSTADLLTSFIVLGFSAFIYMYIHERFIGRIDLLTSFIVVTVPAMILSLAGVEDLVIGLILDYIVFSFIYAFLRGGY